MAELGGLTPAQQQEMVSFARAYLTSPRRPLAPHIATDSKRSQATTVCTCLL